MRLCENPPRNSRRRTQHDGQKLAAMLNTAANIRVHASWDTETTSTVVALRTLARRAHAMLKEARELQKAIVAIIRSVNVAGALTCSRRSAWDRSWPPRCWAPGPAAAVSTQRPSHHPLSAQPLRRPPAQPGTAHRGPEPDPVPASHPRLRRSAYCRRQDQPKDQTLPCPLRRPRPLPPTRKHGHSCLTKHRSVVPRGCRHVGALHGDAGSP